MCNFYRCSWPVNVLYHNEICLYTINFFYFLPFSVLFVFYWAKIQWDLDEFFSQLRTSDCGPPCFFIFPLTWNDRKKMVSRWDVLCAQLPGGESVFRASRSHKCTVLLTQGKLINLMYLSYGLWYIMMGRFFWLINWHFGIICHFECQKQWRRTMCSSKTEVLEKFSSEQGVHWSGCKAEVQSCCAGGFWRALSPLSLLESSEQTLWQKIYLCLNWRVIHHI